MSIVKQQINTEADKESPFLVREDCVGSHLPAQSPSPSLRQLIENALVGVPIKDQKTALKKLLLLLMRRSASHQKICGLTRIQL
jgi:hypothetical protein|tara:strand:- start:522 stop:773 length:252 start_codon:yes stop_codon:yes gene_type:complete